MSLLDLDNVTIGFILDLVEENNSEVLQADEPVEATAEELYRFFK